MIHEIKFHGNWSKAGNRYTETDVKLLKNEKAQNRLGQKFAKCEHDLDMHFYKGPKNKNNFLEGQKSAEWVKQFYGLDIEPSDDRIAILVTCNIGSPKYPLTPWMIAHRISHSLMRRFFVNHYLGLIQNFNDLGHGPLNDSSRWFGCAIGTTRCCRNRTLARTGEIFHELFAQCMLTGRISLKHIENRVFMRNRFRNPEYKFFSDHQVDEINAIIDRLENAVYSVYNELHAMYGSVVVV